MKTKTQKVIQRRTRTNLRRLLNLFNSPKSSILWNLSLIKMIRRKMMKMREMKKKREMKMRKLILIKWSYSLIANKKKMSSSSRIMRLKIWTANCLWTLKTTMKRNRYLKKFLIRNQIRILWCQLSWTLTSLTIHTGESEPRRKWRLTSIPWLLSLRAFEYQEGISGSDN